jgi:outer membrane protein
MRTLARLGLFSGIAVALAMPAAFGSEPAPQVGDDDKYELIFHIGGGGRLKPRYEGASKYLLYPFPIFQLEYLRIPGLTEIDSRKRSRGIYFFPSFNFVGRRKPSDAAVLTGLNTIDWAAEVGLGIGYRVGMFSGYLKVRRGFNGHSGWVGETGIDVTYQASERLRLSGGPRLTFADSAYMGTYFGVSAAEAITSGLPAYNPGSGIKTVGLAGVLSYAITTDIGLHMEGRYDRLTGNAGKSPIVKGGSSNQFSLGIGLTHRISIDLFD